MKKFVLVLSYILMGLGGIFVYQWMEDKFVTYEERQGYVIGTYIFISGLVLFGIHRLLLTKKVRNEEE